ncbi:hypothetical protein [Flavobacterium supellecticarium]|nr:hypothetical protein [Flavobacterium supellecticarium]
MAQQDKIYFNYDKYGYKYVAKERFMNLNSKEKNSITPVFSTTLLSNKYKVEELDFISIPVLGWNQQSYKCGDNLEPLIAFKLNFLFQMVFVVTKEDNLKVGAFEVFDSYNEENRKKDSINNVPFSLHGRPVMSDNKKIEKEIHKYILENPNVFVFMIRGLHGYWAVIEGELVKLIFKGCKITGEQSSKFVCKQYGQEFINDAITDSFRTGYRYLSCPDCKINESIKIDIKNCLVLKKVD